MKMIVGLGNPGQEYVGTRHNVGFEIMHRIAKKHFAPAPRVKFQSELSEIRLDNEKILLLCPLTFMNRSGQAVVEAAKFFQVEPSDILVVCDDFNLQLDRLRFRPSGSAGGQNGLKDIINRLGTNEFHRLRVGIGPVPGKWDPADFVLGKWSTAELNQMDLMVDRCVAAVEDWIRLGIDPCMNQYNRNPETKNKTNDSKKQKDVSSKNEASQSGEN